MSGTDLKARLKRTGKTMTEIGALVGMSSQSLNQVFNAQDVKSGILELLADRLGMTIAELYGVPAGDISTTTGNGNITLTGTGNTNNSAGDCAALLALQQQGAFKGCTAIEVRDKVLQYLHPEEQQPITFALWYGKFENLHENPRTRAIYHATWQQVERYDKNAAQLKFEDITKAWLDGFFASMATHSPSINARNIHLRNIRAAFNNAIDNGVTTCYPFRRLKIRPVATAKRNLKPQALRALFSATVPAWQQKYIDIFQLSFLLIGINIGDLLELPAGADLQGRISFNRKKTHRLYSIKVEPEARAIIDKYRGEVHLLNVEDGCSNYRHFANRLNSNLHAISPSVTTYWARHSWATIAASLDIPDDTIALALGHAGANSTTSIYIERDRRKIDAANRRVIDWVLYNKGG